MALVGLLEEVVKNSAVDVTTVLDPVEWVLEGMVLGLVEVVVAAWLDVDVSVCSRVEETVVVPSVAVALVGSTDCTVELGSWVSLMVLLVALLVVLVVIGWVVSVVGLVAVLLGVLLVLVVLVVVK